MLKIAIIYTKYLVKMNQLFGKRDISINFRQLFLQQICFTYVKAPENLYFKIEIGADNEEWFRYALITGEKI